MIYSPYYVKLAVPSKWSHGHCACEWIRFLWDYVHTHALMECPIKCALMSLPTWNRRDCRGFVYVGAWQKGYCQSNDSCLTYHMLVCVLPLHAHPLLKCAKLKHSKNPIPSVTSVTTQWLDSDGVVTVGSCQQHGDCTVEQLCSHRAAGSCQQWLHHHCAVTVPSRWLMYNLYNNVYV